MKKLVIITFVIAILSIILAYAKYNENKNYNMIEKNKKQLSYIEDKINENSKKLDEVKKEENNLKENNSEKVEILNVWKKMLEEIKNSI